MSAIGGQFTTSNARRPRLAAAAMIGACCTLLGSAVAVAATHNVSIVGQTFEPEQITIAAGDSVRWTNLSDGTHNVFSDDSEFSSGRPLSGRWTFTHTFGSAGDFGYHCQPHGDPGGIGMSGKVIVEGTTGTSFQINSGIAGSWFNPATSGQGILMETADDLGIIALAWFTWTPEGGGYDWLTGSGPFEGDTATVTLFRSTGGAFNDPAPVQTAAAGSAQITFSDCTHASILFELDQPAASGTIALQRILPPNQSCVDANPGAAPAVLPER